MNREHQKALSECVHPVGSKLVEDYFLAMLCPGVRIVCSGLAGTALIGSAGERFEAEQSPFHVAESGKQVDPGLYEVDVPSSHAPPEMQVGSYLSFSPREWVQFE